MRKIKNIRILCFIGLFSLILIGLALYYFSNKQKWALEKQVVAMTGMHINLSFDHSEAIFNGIDSTYTSTSKKKLIVFVDSTSCSGCFTTHISDYSEIYKTMFAQNTELIIVMHPLQSRIKEVKDGLRSESFPVWCIIDKEGEFQRNNPDIPRNRLLHTFLLDENNDIFLIGDPLRNPRIKELLFNTLKAQTLKKPN